MIPFKNDEIASNLEIYHDTIVTWAYKSHIYIAGFKKYASRTGIASFDIMNTGIVRIADIGMGILYYSMLCFDRITVDILTDAG